jgi:tetratricopeptide (TPR) repeat protein
MLSFLLAAAALAQEPLLDMALRLKEEKKYEQAAAILLKLPDDPDAANNLGAVRFLQERYAEADEQFQRAARLNPEDPKPHSNRCLLRVVSESAGALEHCERALKLAADFVPGLLNKGYALLESGKPGEAVPVFARAMELAPSAGEPYLGLALCALRGGKRPDAAPYWRRAAELEPLIGRGPAAYELVEGPSFGTSTRASYAELARLFPLKKKR